MDEFSLTSLGVTLAILLFFSGLFSLAETAMMAANRYRLKHRAARGERGAKLALALLAKTDRLLGVILLGNNLINAAAATLTVVIVERLFGEGQLALAAGTVAVTFAILVFSEITPKVIGATHADRLAPFVSFVLAPLLKPPIIWIVSFVNVFVQGLLKLLRIRESAGSEKLTSEELRSLVLEGQYFRGTHRAMLANLFELENVSVDDVMTPRHLIHGVDLAARPELLRQQLVTSYHTRLPVYEDTLDKVAGILHVKQLVALQQTGEVTADRLRDVMRPAYFVPIGTPLLTQLTQFQSSRERMALVVDEYGEIKGLTTIEDIIEEIIGEFTTTAPGGADSFRRESDGSVVIDGVTPLRTLNRRLGTRFPLDGPKTLNGLIVEQHGAIPDAGMSFSIAGHGLEILQTQDRAVRVVRLQLAAARAEPAPLQSQDERA